MPTSVPGDFKAANRARGFTLLEVMVVIVILAIAVAVALTSLNSRQDRFAAAAQRIASALQSLALEARLGGLPLAWRCGAEGLAFLRWQPEIAGDEQPRGEWLAAGRIADIKADEAVVTRVEIDGAAIDCYAAPIVFPPHAALPRIRVVVADASSAAEQGPTRILLGDSAGRFVVQGADRR